MSSKIKIKIDKVYMIVYAAESTHMDGLLDSHIDLRNTEIHFGIYEGPNNYKF